MCCNFGIDVDNFNPKILYTFEKKYFPNNQLKIHTHDYMSVIYIISGSCDYIINHIPYKVKKGDILALNPHVPHGKILSSEAPLVEFHAGFENFKVHDLPRNFIISDKTTPVIPSTKYDKELTKCFKDILCEQNKNDCGSELILKTLGMRLLVILLRATSQRETVREMGSINFESYDKATIVNAITEFINTNYAEELSLEVISKNMYLSPAYISKLFKDETGESPINYLIKIRLSRAKEFLTKGNLTIKEAAKAVGYEDAYHFSKLFKKHYGYPPSCVKYKAS